MARRLVMISLILPLAFFAAPPAPPAARAGEGAVVVLDTNSVWRVHYSLKAPLVRKAGGAGGLEKISICKWIDRDTAPAAEGWQKPEFDDSQWSRTTGPTNSSQPHVANICMRGRFEVKDPGRARGLKLMLGYSGGAVVYLNGAEIARGNLPKRTGIDEIAEDYPEDAFLAEGGKLLNMWASWVRKPKPDHKRRIDLRTRYLRDVELPTRLLKRGVNLLAVELHRAPYHEKGVRKVKKNWVLNWGTCSFYELQLTAPPGSAVTQNAVRARGFQVWNSDPIAPDFDADFGDPCRKLRPVRIVGTRNGSFSGQVVVGSDKPIKGLKAVPGALKGPGTIPASGVLVRYGLPDGSQASSSKRYPLATSMFSSLDEVPPTEVPIRKRTSHWRTQLVRKGQPASVSGAVVPVWMTVKVPADAKPGKYTGSVTISAAGAQPVKVPVELSVSEFRLPSPKEFRSFIEIVQSPDTLSLEYGVPLWSDKHWRMIEKSLSHMGQVRSRVAHVPLISETNLGNAESMVRWRKKGAGHAYDFSIMDRYLDAFEKNAGRPDIVVFYVWDVFLEGGKFTGSAKYTPKETVAAREKAAGKGPRVTQIGPGAGGAKIEDLQLPLQSDHAASAPLWKPMLDELRSRMAKRGLGKAMALGLVTDTTPTKEIYALFDQLLPGVKWVRHAHPYGRGDRFTYSAAVWAPRFAVDPDEGRRHGWQAKERKVQYVRSIRNTHPVATFRLIMEMNVAGNQPGFGRVGGDFWAVVKDKKGRRRGRAYDRFPQSSWRNLNISINVLGAGSRGPVATTRFEMIREGIQECEARIFIEEAILSKKISGALADRCQKILDERTRSALRGVNCHILGDHFTKYAASGHVWWHAPGVLGQEWFVTSGWQARSKRLFDAAAEVAKRTGRR